MTEHSRRDFLKKTAGVVASLTVLRHIPTTEAAPLEDSVSSWPTAEGPSKITYLALLNGAKEVEGAGYARSPIAWRTGGSSLEKVGVVDFRVERLLEAAIDNTRDNEASRA